MRSMMQKVRLQETPNYITFGTVRIQGKDLRTKDGELSHAEQLRIIHKEVRLDIDWQEQEMKRYYDRSRVESPTMKEGDRVYIRRRTSGEKDFNIKTKRRSQKLDCVKIGPYKIKSSLENDNYEVELPERLRIHPVFHVSLLVPTKNPVSQQIDVLPEFDVE